MKIPLKETLIAGACLALLLGMGTWQVQRLHWKKAIIADLEKSYVGGDHQQLSANILTNVDNGTHAFSYGFVQGHFMKDKAVLIGPRTLDGRSGYHLLIPMAVAGDDRPLIVNAGWVNDLWIDTMQERLATLPQDVTARGLVRYPDWSNFASKNSPKNDLWFRPDPLEIAKAKDIPKIYKIILYADKIDPPLQDVSPREEKWLPRNEHLQYAIFWYAMAVVMFGIYGFYVYGMNKKSPT